jgi:signal transduction histidine kinase
VALTIAWGRVEGRAGCRGSAGRFGAENVYLSIEQRDGDGAVTVVAKDDGRGAGSVRPGHGLTGLRERIEGIGGKMEVVAQPGDGVTLRALLPVREDS